MRRIGFWTAVAVLVVMPGLPAGEPPAKPAKKAEWVTYDAAGVKVLTRYLQEEKDETVLRMALDTLARLGPTSQPAIPAIAGKLNHPRWEIKLEAARTLF